VGIGGSMSDFNVLVLPGDGIGPEVTAQAQRVLDTIGAKWGHSFHYTIDDVGGIAIDKHGTPLRDETVSAAKRADAVLFGAVGGPKWDDAVVRPEAAIVGLRKALRLYSNLRPVKVIPGLENASPIKSERLVGVDIMIVRELTGGLYYGKPKRRWQTSSGRKGVDTLLYTEKEIDRIVRVGFELARGRRKKLTSVDKANVMESSRLWREIANEVSTDYPDVELEHQLADSCSMSLISEPTRYDVLVMENTFGDILSDEAAVLTASLGMLPSASLAGLPKVGSGSRRTVRGLYEPIHGSAPDIAGQGKANPIGTIVSAAFMLQYSFGLEHEAVAINAAVESALAEGLRTADLAQAGDQWVTSSEMTDAIIAGL
jgi:3-isopropylmalate dehydrogenase